MVNMMQADLGIKLWSKKSTFYIPKKYATTFVRNRTIVICLLVWMYSWSLLCHLLTQVMETPLRSMGLQILTC